jgi:hypothetical protein
MLRSNIAIEEKSDYNFIKIAQHIEDVWKIIDKNIPIYFDEAINKGNDHEKMKLNTSFKVQPLAANVRERLTEIFEKRLLQYQKEEKKYKVFFSEESMHEFEDEDDPKGFKSALSTKVPVILKARNSKRELMRDWQERFARSRASDVYSIFFNLVDFMNDYVAENDPIVFGNINDVESLKPLFILNEDDDYNVPGVIGMGIKSSVLFYLNAKYFLGENKNTLYGFYFLSNCENFNLISKTNEFVMINDVKDNSKRGNKRNNIIDQNYWYPYDLFTLYGLRTYRKLKELCAKYKYHLTDEHRFVHVNSFMSEMWDIKYDDIITMTGGDQDDVL